MGKRGGGRGRGFGRGRGGGGRGGGQRSMRTNYEDVAKTNEFYEKYYNELGLANGAEHEEFWSALKRELPNSFRFTGSKGQALPVQQLLKDRYIPEITSIEHNGELVEPPNAIPWFPDQLAWQMTTPKNVVRKFSPFKSFQQFLVSETSVGNISRQEVVSMIPPLLMDVKPGMTVLDMCAAPGSKAAQLIEMVHGGEEARTRKVIRRMKIEQGREVSPEGPLTEQQMQEEEDDGDWSDDGRTTGLVIANDADYRRSHMLIHQMKRLNSPNLIVTNHDATMFPSIRLPSDTDSKGVQRTNHYLKFDRILADVPCSGDGTCRKNVNVWKDWNPSNALGLFSTQLRILVRALQMLKVGGRVVYSTCSMNPVENEAVIAAAIDRCGGTSKVDIIDCKDALPNMKRHNGLSDWKVMDKQGRIWPSWQEVETERMSSGNEGLGKLSEQMFPPSDTEQSIPLDRCMRVYAHQQDTGSFFISVLEKKTEIKARPEAPAKEVQPQAQQPSIVSAVNQIESIPTNGTNPVEKIDALDDIAPPTENGDTEGVTAAARQNKEVAPSAAVTGTKRELDEEADALMSTKRPKFREEVDDPAPQGAEDRQIHWPPPPGAQLEASRPETIQTLPAPPPPLSNTNNALKKNKQPYEEPFKYLDSSQEDLQSIYNFYALSSRFPRDRFMVRNALGHPAKTIYYTSSLARSILETNANSGIKFVHCGVKMFVKQDVQAAFVCPWRIQSEGLPILEAWVGEERVVRLTSRKILRTLLVEMFPKVDGEGWKGLGEIGERVRDIGMGCCVLRIEKAEGEDGFSERMVLPLWRSLHSLNLMLPKEERKAMLLRLFNEDTPLEDHSKDRFHTGNAQQKIKKSPDEGVEAAAKLDGNTSEDEDGGGVSIVVGNDEKDVGAAGLGDEVKAAEALGDDAGKEDDVVPASMADEVAAESTEEVVRMEE
ncbi:tRNA (cytosine-5-)-methyltransferase ncl1 [Lecanora helva]